MEISEIWILQNRDLNSGALDMKFDALTTIKAIKSHA